MLTAEEIQRIISEDYSSEKKLHARKRAVILRRGA